MVHFPYWQAAVRREIMEHPAAGAAIEDKCSTCHMPMAHYMAKITDTKGTVFGHLPLSKAGTQANLLAHDGVACTICHQITADKLGDRESFTGGFNVDTQEPLGQRTVYGPFEVDAGRRRVMQSSSLMMPEKADHIQSSEFCATCHTLYTHALGKNGEDLGELPEQVPYLEWQHSSYQGMKSCQSCHMPELPEATAV